MRNDPRVLVVGTTPDYIDWIRNHCPDRALFVTDPLSRRRAKERPPRPPEELLCELTDERKVLASLQRHLERYRLSPAGVVAFDCESMNLAAAIARHHRLPYPSSDAVRHCRDKYAAKSIWRARHVPTPATQLAETVAEVISFFRRHKEDCVLKPLSGSGSELVFHCTSEAQCRHQFDAIRRGLRGRRAHRLYQPFASARPLVLVEERVAGPEYSCDVVFDNGQAVIIRLTRKLLRPGAPFGTALGYLLPGAWPVDVDPGDLRRTLSRGIAALGIQRAICMVDFIAGPEGVVLLEVTPRPGGDCLPLLLRHSHKLDMLTLAVDFAGGSVDFSGVPPTGNGLWAGVRMHANHGGILAAVDSSRLETDPRVREIQLLRQVGDRIKMPPDDYDSWLLGHAVFQPEATVDPGVQCRSLAEKLRVTIDPAPSTIARRTAPPDAVPAVTS